MILKIHNASNYPTPDGLYIWNGHGWDNKVSLKELERPRLMIKNGEILWLDLPEAEAEATKLEKKEVKAIKQDAK